MFFTFNFTQLDSSLPESITYDVTSERTFLDVIKGLLVQIQNRYSLSDIAILPNNYQPLTRQIVNFPYQNIAQQYGTQFFIVLRANVNGENLAEGTLESQAGLIDQSFAPAPAEMDQTELSKFSEQELNMPLKMEEERKPPMPSMAKEPRPMASAAPASPTFPIISTSSATPSIPRPPSAPGGAPPVSASPSPPPSPPSSERRKEKSKMAKEEKKMDKAPAMKMEASHAKDSLKKRAVMDDFEAEEDEAMPEEETTKSSPGTYAKEVGIEYFDVMNPEKYYPLLMTLTNFKQAILSTQENVLTGERKVQKLETMEITVMNPLVKVRPIFPGCVVTPTELTTNLDLEKDELTFYITPLVKDDVKGYIEVLDDTGKIIYKFETPAKVDDPKYAKTIATYGIIASVLPRLLGFFDVNIDETVSLNSILPAISSIFGGISFTTFFALIGTIIVTISSFAVYFTRKPKSTRRQFKVSDFRLDVLETLTHGKIKK